jgi:hypothetical protein
MGFRSSPEARSKADSAHNIRPPVLMTLYPIAPAGSGQVLSESVESGQPRLVGSGCATSSSATEPRKVIRRVLENTLAKAIGTSRNTPSLRVADSRTACPTKPKLCIADRSSRPRKRGALHNQDMGEVGRTRTKRLVSALTKAFARYRAQK